MSTQTPNLLLPRPVASDLLTRANFNAILDAIDANAAPSWPYAMIDNGGRVWDARTFTIAMDGHFLTDLAVTASSAAVSSPSGGLAGRNGQRLTVDGAGQYGKGHCVTLSNCSLDGTTATMSATAFNTVSGGTGMVGSGQGGKINAAILAISLLGGGTLFFPAGSVMIDQQLVERDNVTLAGVGWNRSELLFWGIPGGCFINQNGTTVGTSGTGDQPDTVKVVNFGLRDLKLRGSNLPFEGACSLQAIYGLTIDHVWVDNSGCGFRFNNVVRGHVTNVITTNIHCTIGASNSLSDGHAVFFEQGTKHVSVRGLFIDQCEGNPINFDAGHANPNQGHPPAGNWAAAVDGCSVDDFLALNVCTRDAVWTDIPNLIGTNVGPLGHSGLVQMQGCINCTVGNGRAVNVGVTSASGSVVGSPLFALVEDQSGSLNPTTNNLIHDVVAHNVTGRFAELLGVIGNTIQNCRAYNALENGTAAGMNLSLVQFRSGDPEEPSYNPGRWILDTADNRVVNCSVLQPAGGQAISYLAYVFGGTQQSSTLSGGIGSTPATGGTLVLAYNASWPRWGQALVDSEYVTWDSITQNVGVSTTLNAVQRGQNGSTAASHANGAAIATVLPVVKRNRIVGGSWPALGTAVLVTFGDAAGYSVAGANANVVEYLGADDTTYGKIPFGSANAEWLHRGVANGLSIGVNGADKFQFSYNGSLYLLRPSSDMAAQLGESNVSRWAFLYMAGPDGTNCLDLKGSTSSSTQSPRIAFRDNQASSKKILVQKNGNYLYVMDDAGTARARLAGDSTVPTQLDSGAAIGGGATILKNLTGTATWDPANLADGATATTTVTVTGAAVGDAVFVGFTSITAGGWSISAQVTATNTVTVTLTNHTGGAVDLPSGTLRAVVFQH